MKTKLASILVSLCVLCGLGLATGCAVDSTTTTQVQSVGNISVAAAWAGYAIAYDAVNLYAAEGRISPSTATTLSNDFTAAYTAINSLQELNSSATTQPTLATVNQQALIVATAILQVQNDLKGQQPQSSNPPAILNIPTPPAVSNP